jgi:hypothetical protein
VIFKKSFRFKFILETIVLLGVVSLISFFSYSWFKNKDNPVISANDIKVSAADGLVIKLTPDTVGRTEVNLNQVITGFDEFILKQVSSVDGVNFYKIDFGQGLAVEDPEFVKLNSTYNMNEDGYISYTFYLTTETFAKHVYIHKDTIISGDAADAMRISMKITDSDGAVSYYIFGTEPEDGIYNDYTTKAVAAEGRFNFYDIDSSLVQNQTVRLFSYKGGGRENSDDDEIDLTKILATIPAHESIEVQLKIWLEGGDEDCNTTIAGSTLDTIIKFGSANVLLSAPDLTGNSSTHTIAGLTEEMEYSYTNGSDASWLPITDTNMVFTSDTVYVRIAEVTGVSPCSYAKVINF